MNAQEKRLPQPPSEAVLIRRARKARGLTAAEAAAKAGVVKSSRWGQIENGYIMKDRQANPTSAGDMQLAHMARVVGVTPEQLAEAGREDAAEILREMERQDTSARPSPIAANPEIIETPTRLSASSASPPTEADVAGMAQVDAIRAALRAELEQVREEARRRDEEAQRRDEENKAALSKLADELRALREERGA